MLNKEQRECVSRCFQLFSMTNGRLKSVESRSELMVIFRLATEEFFKFI